MTKVFASVKKASASVGRPKGKKGYVVLFQWEDVKPLEMDVDGITVKKMTFLDTKKPVAIYATPDTISAIDKMSGETDAEGYLHVVAFNSPGDTKEQAVFRSQAVNMNLGAIVINCGDVEAKLAGTPCSPLRFKKDDGKDDKDAVRREIELGNSIPVDPMFRIALSAIPQTGDKDIDDYLGLTAGQVLSA